MQDEAPDYLAETLLGLGLVVAPFAFGTTEGWSRGLLCGIAFLLLLRRYCRFGSSVFDPKALPPVLWGAVALVLLASLQALHYVSPEVLGLARGPFSLSRSLTMAFILDWVCYATLLVSVPSIYFRPEPILRLAWLLLLLGVAIAVAGIAQSAAGNTHYLGIRLINPLNVAFGPFPNKNHAGTVLAMSFCAGVGILAALIARARTLLRDGRTDEIVGRSLVLLCLLSVVFAGLLASRARAPLLALVITGAALSAFIFFKRSISIRAQTAVAVLFAVAVAAGAMALSAAPAAVTRVTTGSANSYPFRIAMAGDALRVIGDFPLFGIGLGAYRVISPLYHDSILSYFFVDYVHSDPLQLAAEGGVPVTCFFYFLALCTLYRSIRRCWSSGSPDRYAAFGILFACGIVLLHQLVDFPSRIPGVQAIFIALLAAGWGYTTPVSQLHRPPSAIRQAIFAFALAAFWSLAFVPKVAAAYCDLLASRTIPPSTHYYRHAALLWEPTFDRQCAMAREYTSAAKENPVAQIILWRQALRHSRAALDLEPFHPELRRFHAAILRALGRKGDARFYSAPP